MKPGGTFLRFNDELAQEIGLVNDSYSIILSAMVDEAVHLWKLVKDQRKAQDLTQAELAHKVGTTQSQISLFEKGQRHVLSERIITNILEALEIDKEEASLDVDKVQKCGICSNSECPGGTLGLIGSAVVFRPMMWRVRDPINARPKCAMCGEVVALACETCGAPIKPGLFCSACGKQLVPPPAEIAEIPEGMRAARIDEINRRNRGLVGVLELRELPVL
jgi:transcriptional regulator with XRE-family HTH domain